MANSNSKLFLLRLLLILGLGGWVFSPALHGLWLMDDDFYLPQNALLGDPHRLWKIWFAPGSLIEYYPIEATLQTLQWHLWHDNTFGYHATNLLLHLAGALLLWRLLEKFHLRYAWLGGLLFAIHPVVVESVAWIAEFKNVLSLPPFLLALCAWSDYEEKHRPRDYLLALGFFLIAMLCKISMATFPLVILLYAWWKRDRLGWGDLKVSLPFFLISLLLGLTAFLAGDGFREAHHQSIENPPLGGPLSHLALAGLSIAFYFSKAVCPVGLLPTYPQWPVDPPSLLDFLPWPILTALLGWLWIKRATWGRHALLGSGFFLLTLLPFIGFTSTSYMRFTWVMDHFLYLPLIGLIGLAAAALQHFEDQLSQVSRTVLPLFIAAGMALLAWGSHTYAGLFVGQEELWTYTVARNPSAWLARNNLGNIYVETGRIPAAIEQYQLALQINPGVVDAHNNLGLALNLTGHPAEAIQQYRLALQVNPHFALTHVNLGDLYSQLGRIPEAIDQYEQALQIEPNYKAAQESLAKLRRPPPR